MTTNSTEERHEYTSVKMFDSKKTAKYFVEIVDAFNADKAYMQKAAFVQEVKDLFDAKITSEQGEYDEFRVTEKDLKGIVATY